MSKLWIFGLGFATGLVYAYYVLAKVRINIIENMNDYNYTQEG